MAPTLTKPSFTRPGAWVYQEKVDRARESHFRPGSRPSAHAELGRVAALVATSYDPHIPIGPQWLMEAAHDINGLGGRTILIIVRRTTDGRYGVAGLEVLARAVRDATPPARDVIPIGVTADAVHEVLAPDTGRPGSTMRLVGCTTSTPARTTDVTAFNDERMFMAASVAHQSPAHRPKAAGPPLSRHVAFGCRAATTLLKVWMIFPFSRLGNERQHEAPFAASNSLRSMHARRTE